MNWITDAIYYRMNLCVSTASCDPNALILLVFLAIFIGILEVFGSVSFLFFCTCTCFVSFDTGAVDADILHIRIQCQILKDLFEDPRFLPLCETLIHSLPGTIPFG